MPVIGDRAERAEYLIPAALVIETLPQNLGYEGAALSLTHASVELGHKPILKIYV